MKLASAQIEYWVEWRNLSVKCLARASSSSFTGAAQGYSAVIQSAPCHNPDFPGDACYKWRGVNTTAQKV